MPQKDREEYLAYQREYSRTRRDEATRSAERRLDPAYNAAQIERKRRWRAANKERHLAVSRFYDADQLRNNPQRHISKNLRNILNKAVIRRGMGKYERSLETFQALTGCTMDEFFNYIERQFTPGMTWDNYGVHGWTLDHIKPLIRFDLTDEKQVAEAFHYTNIRPLWAAEGPKWRTQT